MTTRSEPADRPTMTAIIKTHVGPDSVALGRRPIPTPGPGEVLVEVHAAGVCGTDRHIQHDTYPTRPPVVMGHEIAGVVAAVGPGGAKDWIGRRVACETHHQRCDCRYCRDGRRNLCIDRTSMGSFVDGGFASHVRVPADRVHELPDRISDHAAALCEPLACVCHLLLDPPVVNVADEVVVFGPGPMGLLAAQVARAAGGRVTVVGLPADRPRLAVAEQLGFPTTHVAPEESADVVVECSGHPGGAAAALEAARRGGRYVAVGIFGSEVNVPLDRVLYKELMMTSGFGATAASWRRALAVLAAGLVDLDSLVSGAEPLSQWPRVFAELSRSDRLKVVFDPRRPD